MKKALLVLTIFSFILVIPITVICLIKMCSSLYDTLQNKTRRKHIIKTVSYLFCILLLLSRLEVLLSMTIQEGSMSLVINNIHKAGYYILISCGIMITFYHLLKNLVNLSSKLYLDIFLTFFCFASITQLINIVIIPFARKIDTRIICTMINYQANSFFQTDGARLLWSAVALTMYLTFSPILLYQCANCIKRIVENSDFGIQQK